MQTVKMTMKKLRVVSVVMVAVVAVALAACQGDGGGQAESGRVIDPDNLRVPDAPDVSDTVIEVPEAALPAVEPLPEIDFVGLLVTEAYANYDVNPTATPAANAFLATPTATVAVQPGTLSGELMGPVEGSAYVSPLLVTPTPFKPAPPLVIIPSSPLIAQAEVDAICTRPGIGDCLPTMVAGQDLYFTFQFKDESPKVFEYGASEVVIVRDGVGFATIISTNGRDPNPPPNEDDSNVMRTLAVGDTAEFRAGLEDIAPGYYEVRLRLCLMPRDQCELNRGWTYTGGEHIEFLIVSD